MHTIRSKALAVALGSAFAAAVAAQPMYEHRERNGVDWVSGGVGLDERDAMRDVASDFNLRVVLAVAGNGEYRAQVPVTIEDENGNAVLATVTDGPWLFARVPPGRYRVRTADGDEASVNVGARGGATVYLRAAGAQ